ncbi:MAG: hypothetical protein AB1442_13575, partial [Nitrospirota bacterium]
NPCEDTCIKASKDCSVIGFMKSIENSALMRIYRKDLTVPRKLAKTAIGLLLSIGEVLSITLSFFVIVKVQSDILRDYALLFLVGPPFIVHVFAFLYAVSLLKRLQEQKKITETVITNGSTTDRD